jgi:hypothetical protein
MDKWPWWLVILLGGLIFFYIFYVFLGPDAWIGGGSTGYRG